MNIFQVLRWVEEIEAVRDDDEKAHSMEDQLWREVLEEIGKGTIHATGLANAALETTKIEFARWCA